MEARMDDAFAAVQLETAPELAKEAEETAQRVMQGGKLDIQCMRDTEIHVQRIPKGSMFETLALLDLRKPDGEQAGKDGGFRQQLNEAQYGFLHSAIDQYNEAHTEFKENRQEAAEGKKPGFGERLQLKNQHARIESALQDTLDQIALTDEQRSLVEDGLNTGLWADASVTTISAALTAVNPKLGTLVTAGNYGWNYVANRWSGLNGDIDERAQQLGRELMSDRVETGPTRFD